MQATGVKPCSIPCQEQGLYRKAAGYCITQNAKLLSLVTSSNGRGVAKPKQGTLEKISGDLNRLWLGLGLGSLA